MDNTTWYPFERSTFIIIFDQYTFIDFGCRNWLYNYSTSSFLTYIWSEWINDFFFGIDDNTGKQKQKISSIFYLYNTLMIAVFFSTLHLYILTNGLAVFLFVCLFVWVFIYIFTLWSFYFLGFHFFFVPKIKIFLPIHILEWINNIIIITIMIWKKWWW